MYFPSPAQISQSKSSLQDLYNYADDNTLSCVDSSFASVKATLEAEGNELVDWFTRNQMQANPDKFHGLALSKRAFDRKPTFSIKAAELECTEDAKLLDVDIDYMLNFNTHITNVCRRASRQINVLRWRNVTSLHVKP